MTVKDKKTKLGAVCDLLIAIQRVIFVCGMKTCKLWFPQPLLILVCRRYSNDDDGGAKIKGTKKNES